jgi:transcriptional regulator with AAA-type ATPase domain
MSCSDVQPNEFGLDHSGGLDINCWETGKELRDAVFNGALTLDQVEAMLLEAAVDKARGNLSSAARMLGLTRPQIAYRLKRLHGDSDAAGGQAGGAFEQAHAGSA